MGCYNKETKCANCHIYLLALDSNATQSSTVVTGDQVSLGNQF